MKRSHSFLPVSAPPPQWRAVALGAFVWSLGRRRSARNSIISHAVLDRDGTLLRAFATTEGRWRLPATEKDVDPRFLRLLFAYEDKRFRSHHGVDPQALARAAFQFMSRGHIVSGGSTLTMQVARLLEPREHRNLTAKLRQIVRALEIERALSKTQILSLYLSLAPYGGNLEGIRAASLAYFGKEPRKLSLGEAALLVALPQSPELRRPDRFPEQRASGTRPRARPRGGGGRGAARRDCAREGGSRAARTPCRCRCWRRIRPIRSLPPSRTPAFIASPSTPACRSLLEDLARERARALGPQISVAILAVDNATGEVRARVALRRLFRRPPRRAGGHDAGACARPARRSSRSSTVSPSRTACCIRRR